MADDSGPEILEPPWLLRMWWTGGCEPTGCGNYGSKQAFKNDPPAVLLGLRVWRPLRRSVGARLSHRCCVWGVLCSEARLPGLWVACHELAVVLLCARAAGEAGGVLWNLNSLGLGVPERSLDTVKSSVHVWGRSWHSWWEELVLCPSLAFPGRHEGSLIQRTDGGG